MCNLEIASGNLYRTKMHRIRRKKPIKLTVSCAVSEKKRSDANSVEVLVRAHKALQKTYKFTQNVTSKA